MNCLICFCCVRGIQEPDWLANYCLRAKATAPRFLFLMKSQRTALPSCEGRRSQLCWWTPEREGTRTSGRPGSKGEPDRWSSQIEEDWGQHRAPVLRSLINGLAVYKMAGLLNIHWRESPVLIIMMLDETGCAGWREMNYLRRMLTFKSLFSNIPEWVRCRESSRRAEMFRRSVAETNSDQVSQKMSSDKDFEKKPTTNGCDCKLSLISKSDRI